MILKMLSAQVPQFWETIKFVVRESGGIDDKYFESFLNELLQALLSDKYQCFVKLGDNRELLGMAITKMTVDKFADKKIFSIQYLHTLNFDLEVWKEIYNFIIAYAKNLNCSHLSVDTVDSRIWDKADTLGLIEFRRYYLLNIGK